jgi:hypothetical protein
VNILLYTATKFKFPVGFRIRVPSLQRLLLYTSTNSMYMNLKRHYSNRSPSPVLKLDDEDDSYEPYVPVAQRRRQRMARWYAENKQPEDIDDVEETQNEEELKKEKARMERTLLIEAQEVHSKKAVEGMFFST